MHCNWQREDRKKALFNGYFRREKNHSVIYLVEQRNLFGFLASDGEIVRVRVSEHKSYKFNISLG